MIDQVFRIKQHVSSDMLENLGFISEKIGDRHKCYLPPEEGDIYISISIDMDTRLVTVMYKNALEVLIPLFKEGMLEYNTNIVRDTFDWSR